MKKNSVEGTVSELKYDEGPVYVNDDIWLHERYYTYKADERLVSGWTMTAVVIFDRPVRDVWPYVKDWNLFMNSYGYYWSGVAGDLEGKSFYFIAKGSNEPVAEYPYEYQVLRVIPEHLITISQPIPKDGGNGGVSPGFHVITLDERDKKTIVTFTLEHAVGMEDMNEERAAGVWREAGQQKMWGGHFIPTLKRLVYEGK